MAEILWVNPVGSAAFDEETLELIEAVRSPQHEARVRHLPGSTAPRVSPL